jgi:hypothetical protein
VLFRLRARILGRLKGALGTAAPTKMGFLDGAVAAHDTRPAVAEEQAGGAAPAPPPATVVSAAQAIGDPALRDLFVAAAGRYLGRGRNDP